MNKSLKFRKDYRSKKQFIEDVKKYTKRESMLMNLFLLEMEHRGYNTCAIDNGINNDGKFVKQSSCNADFLVTIDNQQQLIEVKYSPVDYMLTFKEHNLKEYIKQNATILVFFGGGYNILDYDWSKVKFGLIYPDKIQLILDQNIPQKIVKFGNKLCCRFYKQDFDKYFQTEKLTFFNENGI